MHQPPLVTILMATYNGAKFVAEQLDSILAQSYPCIEVIIADDASSDKTMDVLRIYANKYPNVKVFSNKSRLGFVKNFERLLQHAEGRYFAFSDQDDIWDTEKISHLMREMVEKEKLCPDQPVMVHCDLAMVDEEGTLLFPSYARFRCYHYSKYKDIPTMISKGGVMGNTMLINAALRHMVLPFGAHVIHHDYWIPVVNEIVGHRISLSDPLVFYRIHSNNTSNKKHLLSKRKPKNLNELLPYRDNNRYEVLKEVLRRYKMSKEDKRSILIFLLYLRAQQGWIKYYPILVKEGFFQNSIFKHYTMIKRFAKASLMQNRSLNVHIKRHSKVDER